MKSIALILCLLNLSSSLYAQLQVPAFTAYSEPDPNALRVSRTLGITGWKNPQYKILWFGEMKAPATIDANVQLRLPTDVLSKLRLTVAGQSHDTEVKGSGTNLVTAHFGKYECKAGYQRFTLEALHATPPFGDIAALLLDGVNTDTAHFNLKPRRNAASVHIGYPVPQGTNVSAFYCEVTGIEDPVATYYMACGWHRGYFGMQVNSKTERRIIFSVWDSGNESVSRSKVASDDRVTLLGKGEGVSAGDFGNEGTGGHSHLVYPWKTGEKQKFLVTAQPTNNTYTIYSGYWFHPGKQQWMLISSWRAPKDGSWLKSLYSFSEDFGDSTGHLVRKARYGNQWIRTDSGQWLELTAASFSHDATGKSDRLDRFMGVENGEFFLQHGGFVPGFTKSGEKFTRAPKSRPPALELPGRIGH